MRILLAPLDICGILRGLKHGFTALGHEAHFIDLSDSAVVDLSRETAWPIRAFQRAHFRARETRLIGKWQPQRTRAWLQYHVSKAVLTLWALFRIDVFIFKSGESIYASRIDQRLFRAFNKVIIHTFYGSDERPRYLSPGVNDDDNADQLAQRVRAQRERLDSLRECADFTICNPLSAHFQTGRICVSQVFGTPIDQNKLAARHGFVEAEPSMPGHVRILHAPSSVDLKGTDVVRREISALKERGYPIQYIEVTGRSNAEVLKEIELCDFVVDELYSDDYGAVLATEAVVLGRPVIVAGYGREELDRFVPPEAALPALYAHPDDFATVLEKMVADPVFRAEQRRNAEKFAPHRHAISVAERFVRLIEGKAPDDWFFDAGAIRYLHGVAGHETKIIRRIGQLVDAFGSGALCLDDKPQLRDRLVAFAQAESGERVNWPRDLQ